MVNQATFVALEKETYLEFLLGSLPTSGIVLETDNYTIHYLFRVEPARFASEASKPSYVYATEGCMYVATLV